MVVTAIPIFLGAFLLFLVQPLTARRLLPWFGGSPAVWIVSLLFFQSALLAGYGYAHLLSRRRSPRLTSALHIGLLFSALAFLPVGPGGPPPGVTLGPAVQILRGLGASLAIPVLVLAATSPLLQSWSPSPERVYRLFAVSNFGSLLGLLSYPFILEPLTSVATQVWIWSAAFTLFVAFCAVAAARAEGGRAVSGPASVASPIVRGLWLLLPATGSVVLMATSNQLTRNVAAVPFLWVLPLGLYLVSFIIAFERDRWYVRGLWGSLFLASLLGILVLLSLEDEPAFLLQLAAYSVNLLSGSVVCHGELYRLRPDVRDLTGFYLRVAFGGVLGGVFVSLVAPEIFRGYWEYPLGLGLVYLAGGAAMLRSSPGKSGAWITWVVGGACLGVVLWSHVRSDGGGALTMRRSFFGVVRVYERHVNTRFWRRELWNGPVAHGAQLLAPGRRREPILYYSPDTGVGLALFHGSETGAAAPRERRIGVVGLGTGSLAAYGRPGDLFRFYEVNPDVVDVAREYFYYIEDTDAEVEIVAGDARLSLVRELRDGGGERFDLLVIDAFTGDAIPVHLLTREAFALYDRHLAPDGILAVHVSNLHFDLRPVVRSHAEGLGAVAVLVESDANEEKDLYLSDWVLVTRNPSFIASPSLQARITPWRADSGYRPEDFGWTDDYSNLFRVLK